MMSNANAVASSKCSSLTFENLPFSFLKNQIEKCPLTGFGFIKLSNDIAYNINIAFNFMHLIYWCPVSLDRAHT